MQEQTKPKYIAGAQRSGPGACGDIEPSYGFYEHNGQILITDFRGCKECPNTEPYSMDVDTLTYRGKLEPGQIREVVLKLKFDEVSDLVSDWTRRTKKPLPRTPVIEDLVLIARKTGPVESEFFEVYRGNHTIFFRDSKDPGAVIPYTGRLGSHREKSLREVINKLDFEHISVLASDIGNEQKIKADLPVLKKQGAKMMARVAGAGSHHFFYQIGNEILMMTAPGEPGLFGPGTTAYRYNGNLSPEDFTRIVDKLGFNDVEYLIMDWREPPQTWETHRFEPRNKRLYVKKEEGGKTIIFYKGELRDMLYFWERPEPDKMQVYEGHLFDWHWKEFDDVVEKLSIEELSLLLNDIKVDLDMRIRRPNN